MAGSIGKILSPLIVIGLLGWWGYNWFATHRANSSVEDSNAEILEANALLPTFVPSFQRLLGAETLESFPGNREAIRSEVQKTADGFAKAAALYRSAAAKMSVVAQKDVDATFREYIQLQIKATGDLGDSKTELSKVLLMLLDPKIDSAKKFEDESDAAMKAFERLHQQSEAAARQADDLAAKNPSKIKR